MFFSGTKVFVSIFLITVFCQNSFSAKRYKKERPAPSYLNAYLLEAKELRVSLFGEINYGISSDYQVGTQALGLLNSVPNIFLKHKMFDLDKGKSTYALSLGAFFFKEKPQIVNLIKEKAQGSFFYFSFLGSSVRSSLFSFHYGLSLIDGSLKIEEEKNPKSMSLLGIVGSSGLDIKVLDYLSFNASLLLPLLEKSKVENYEMSLSNESPIFGALPVIGSLGTCFKWRSFSFELTDWLLRFNKELIQIPLLNIFYSFK